MLGVNRLTASCFHRIDKRVRDFADNLFYLSCHPQSLFHLLPAVMEVHRKVLPKLDIVN